MREPLPKKPKYLPFLEAVCWDLTSIEHLSLDEILSRYERGWVYRDALADLGDDEREFLKQLAIAKGSWLQLDV